MIYPSTFPSRNLRTKVGLPIALLCSISSIPYAWCAPTAVGTPTGVQATKPEAHLLDASEMEHEEALKANVSFVAKSLSLQDVLALLQKKSNVAITIAPDSVVPNVRVTASIQAIPLSQVLLGLSRLYGVRWASTGPQTYIMLPCDRNAFEKGLLQLGDLIDYEGRFLANLRHSPDHMDWPQEITKYVSAQELRFGATPKISGLPPELVSKIRHEKEQMAALRLLETYQAAMEASVEDDILHIENPKVSNKPPQANANAPSTKPRIFVRTRDGKAIAALNGDSSVDASKNNGKQTEAKNNPGPT